MTIIHSESKLVKPVRDALLDMKEVAAEVRKTADIIAGRFEKNPFETRSIMRIRVIVERVEQ